VISATKNQLEVRFFSISYAVFKSSFARRAALICVLKEALSGGVEAINFNNIMSADEDVPPLDDMSEQVSAARSSRSGFGSHQSSANSVLYGFDKEKLEPIVGVERKIERSPEEKINGLKPGFLNGVSLSGEERFAVGSRVKVTGLSKAAQYNGQTGVIQEIFKSEEKLGVKLDSGNVLKIKYVNLQLLDDVLRPTGEDGGAAHHLKNLGIQSGQVPEWMQPTESLLGKVAADEALMKAASNPRFNKVLDEVAKDPKAFEKYKDDKEIVALFSKMVGVFGKQYEESEQSKAPAKVLPPPKVVHIQGVVGPCAMINGTYEATSEVLGGQPLYRRRTDIMCIEYWPTKSQWQIKPMHSKGQDVCSAYINVSGSLAGAVPLNTWMVWDGRAQVHQPAVRLLIETATALEVPDAPSSVFKIG
jgi:hypothetical protein